jgi:hypothetical protein
VALPSEVIERTDKITAVVGGSSNPIGDNGNDDSGEPLVGGDTILIGDDSSPEGELVDVESEAGSDVEGEVDRTLEEIKDPELRNKVALCNCMRFLCDKTPT